MLTRLKAGIRVGATDIDTINTMSSLNQIVAEINRQLLGLGLTPINDIVLLETRIDFAYIKTLTDAIASLGTIITPATSITRTLIKNLRDALLIVNCEADGVAAITVSGYYNIIPVLTNCSSTKFVSGTTFINTQQNIVTPTFVGQFFDGSFDEHWRIGVTFSIPTTLMTSYTFIFSDAISGFGTPVRNLYYSNTDDSGLYSTTSSTKPAWDWENNITNLIQSGIVDVSGICSVTLNPTIVSGFLGSNMSFVLAENHEVSNIRNAGFNVSNISLQVA